MKYEKLYTHRGDSGSTDFGGDRVYKNNEIIRIIGKIDSLNAFLGACPDPHGDIRLVQNDLIYFMGQLHIKGDFSELSNCIINLQKSIKYYSNALDEKEVQQSGWFLYGSDCNAALAIACTQCRELECDLVEYYSGKDEVEKGWILCYINALSKMLYLLSVYVHTP